MPDFNHPPYNVIQPRQLNRWLDINSQNGPLGRTHTYIEIPAFNIIHDWNGYSELVAVFDYSSPNNFSFLQSIATNNSFVLCISYVNADYSVVRYCLNDEIGTFYFDIPLYVGQMIKKNFRIEVWNTSSSNSILLSAVRLLTSVRGVQDYRFGLDFALCITSGEKVLFDYDQALLIAPVAPYHSTLYTSGGYNGQNAAISDLWTFKLLGGTTYYITLGNATSLALVDTFDGSNIETYTDKFTYEPDKVTEEHQYYIGAPHALIGTACTLSLNVSGYSLFLPFIFPNSPTINN